MIIYCNRNNFLIHILQHNLKDQGHSHNSTNLQSNGNKKHEMDKNSCNIHTYTHFLPSIPPLKISWTALNNDIKLKSFIKPTSPNSKPDLTWTQSELCYKMHLVSDSVWVKERLLWSLSTSCSHNTVVWNYNLQADNPSSNSLEMFFNSQQRNCMYKCHHAVITNFKKSKKT